MKYVTTTAGLVLLGIFCLAAIQWIGLKPPGDEDMSLLFLGPLSAIWFYSRKLFQSKSLGGKIMAGVIAIGAAIPLLTLGIPVLLGHAEAIFIKIGLVTAFVAASFATIDIYVLWTGGGSLAWFLNLHDYQKERK
jgi:hypothetical protein